MERIQIALHTKMSIEEKNIHIISSWLKRMSSGTGKNIFVLWRKERATKRYW